MASFEAAARSLKVEPIIAPVHSDVEIETAMIALGREPGGGLVVLGDSFMLVHRAPVIVTKNAEIALLSSMSDNHCLNGLFPNRRSAVYALADPGSVRRPHQIDVRRDRHCR